MNIIKNLKNKFICIIILLLLISCNKITKKEFYDTGELKVEYTINRKTKDINGIYKEYDKKGFLASEIKFVNGIRQGEAKKYNEEGNNIACFYFKNDLVTDTAYFYYSSGEIKQLKVYDNGQIKGDVIDFYKNGNISYKGTYLNDTLIYGSEYEYYNDGKLKYYKYRDKLGNLVYIRFYDKNGYFIKENGHLINGDIIKLEDGNYVLYIEAVKPPNTNFVLKVKEITKDEIFDNTFYSDTALVYKLKKSIESKVELHIVLTDTIVNKISEDFLVFNHR